MPDEFLTVAEIASLLKMNQQTRPGTFVAEDAELRVLAAFEPSGGDRGSSKRPGR